MYTHITHTPLLLSVGTVILPVQVKCRNLTSLDVLLPSPIYNVIVLSTSLHTFRGIVYNVIIFTSAIKYNLENSREVKCVEFNHIFCWL